MCEIFQHFFTKEKVLKIDNEFNLKSHKLDQLTKLWKISCLPHHCHRARQHCGRVAIVRARCRRAHVGLEGALLSSARWHRERVASALPSRARWHRGRIAVARTLASRARHHRARVGVESVDVILTLSVSSDCHLHVIRKRWSLSKRVAIARILPASDSCQTPLCQSPARYRRTRHHHPQVTRPASTELVGRAEIATAAEPRA